MSRSSLVTSILALVPIAAWGHPGHGTNPDPSFVHALADHAVGLWLLGAALAAGTLAWRRRRS